MKKKLIRKFNTGKLERTFTLRAADIDEEARTVPLAFSSEEPVERWFGNEVLSHDPSHVDLGRLQNGGALLVDHDPSDHIGTVEDVKIDSDRRGRAVVRFGRSARAQEIFNDVIDGIRKHVSVGYRIFEMLEDTRTNTFTATNWMPHEISFVSIPADATVGVGRSEPSNDKTYETNIISFEDRTMKKLYDEHGNVVDAEGNILERKQAAPAPAPAPAAKPVDTEAELAAVRKAEIERAKEIRALGKEHGQEALAEQAIQDGRSIDEMRVNVLDILKDTPPTRSESTAEIGMTDKEVKRFSMLRALDALANPNDKRAQERAAFEIECSQAVAQKRGIDTAGFFVPKNGDTGFVKRSGEGIYTPGVAVPFDVVSRAINVTTAGDGQEFVADDLLSGSFIDVLRNSSAVTGMGARMLNDLVGDISIPRKTSGSAATWISAEDGDAGVSDPQFDQVQLSPKTAGVYSEITRQMLKQSSLDIEALLRQDLAAGMALLLDKAVLYGTGLSGQPEGISAATGVNAPTSFAAANPTYAEVVAMETAVANQNANMGALGYLLNTAMRGALKTTEKASGTAQFVWEPGNTLNGYPTNVSNQITAGDLFYGNWSDVLIGLWGNLDLLIDPYTNSLKGKVRIVAHQSMDVALRHPESFAFNNDGI